MISVILNIDTRPLRNEATGLFNGTVSRDYLLHGLRNKKKFMDGFDCEFIVYVDEHESIPNEMYRQLRDECDVLVLSRHIRHYRGIDNYTRFNDINYIQALSLARGEWVMHFDQDVAAFTASPHEITSLMAAIASGQYKFVSLPSVNTPNPVHDPSFGDKWWASTRFFICQRESIDITALEHAIRDPEWAYATYGRTPRINPWTEHFLTLIAGHSVYYPPVELDKWAVFPWAHYKEGTLEKLNDMPYGEVADKLYKIGLPYDGVDANLLNLP